MLFFSDPDPRSIRRDTECTHTILCLCEDHIESGDVSIGHEHLTSIDHVVRTIPNRPCLQNMDITARLIFCQAE